jgi:hypothetical protein
MKKYWEGGIAPRILEPSTKRRRVFSFTPRPIYPTERPLGTHWVGGWVGPIASLNAVEKRKIPSPPPGNRNSEPRSSSTEIVERSFKDDIGSWMIKQSMKKNKKKHYIPITQRYTMDTQAACSIFNDFL